MNSARLSPKPLFFQSVPSTEVPTSGCVAHLGQAVLSGDGREGWAPGIALFLLPPRPESELISGQYVLPQHCSPY